MRDLQHMLRAAARREALQRSLRAGARWLLAGTIAAWIVLVLDRTRVLSAPFWWFIAPPAAGLIIGCALAWLRPSSRFELATRLDALYRLRDRLGSAEALAQTAIGSTRHDPAFAALVQRDADQFAAKLDVRSAMPIVIPPLAVAAMVCSIALWPAVRYIPVLEASLMQSPSSVSRNEESANAREGRAALADAISTVTDELAADPAFDEADREQLEVLDQLAAQLEAESTEPESLDAERAQAETAATLNELANRFDEKADEEDVLAERLAQRFRGIEPPRDRTMTTEELREALARGEFGDAADQIERMLRGAAAQPEDSRRESARELREIGDQIENKPEATVENQNALESQREAIRDALRDQGFDEQKINDLMHSAEELAREMQERGVDEEQFRQLARDLEKMNKERQLEERANEEAHELADAMRDAADEIDSPPLPRESSSPPDAPQTHEQPDEAPTGEQTSKDDAGPPRDDQTQREAEPREGTQEQGPQETPTRGNQPQSAQREQPARDSSPKDESRETPGQPQQQPTGRESTQSDQDSSGPDSRQKHAEEKPGGEDHMLQPGDSPEKSNEEGANQQDDLQAQREPRAGESPNRTARDERSPDPSSADHALQKKKNAAERLREWQKRREQTSQRRDLAERAREAARRMAEDMTEEERREWIEQWQDMLARDRQPPADEPGDLAGDEPGAHPGENPTRSHEPLASQSDDLDLGGDELARELIAEWLNDEPGLEPIGTAPGSTTARASRARRAAERAVEESALPSRYHDFIKRYFGRLPGSDAPATDASGGDQSGGGGESGS